MNTNSLGGLIKVADQFDIIRQSQQQDYPDWAPDGKTDDELKQGLRNAWVNVGYPLLKTVPDTVGDVLNGVRYGANSVVNGITGQGWNGTTGITGYVPPDSTARLHDGLVSQPIVADALARAVDTGVAKAGDMLRSSESKIGPAVERENAKAHDQLRRSLYLNPDAYENNKPVEDLEAQMLELAALRGAAGAGSSVASSIPQATAPGRYAASAANVAFPFGLDATYRAGITPTYSGTYDTSRRTDGSVPFYFDESTYVPPVIENYADYFDMLKFLGPLAAHGAGWAAGRAGLGGAKDAFTRAAAFVPPGAVEGTMLGLATGHTSAADDLADIRRRNFGTDPDSPFMKRQRELAAGDEHDRARRHDEYNGAKLDAAWLKELEDRERSAARTNAALGAWFPMLATEGRIAYAVPAAAAASRAGYEAINGRNSVPSAVKSP